MDARAALLRAERQRSRLVGRSKKVDRLQEQVSGLRDALRGTLAVRRTGLGLGLRLGLGSGSGLRLGLGLVLGFGTV